MGGGELVGKDVGVGVEPVEVGSTALFEGTDGREYRLVVGVHDVPCRVCVAVVPQRRGPKQPDPVTVGLAARLDDGVLDFCEVEAEYHVGPGAGERDLPCVEKPGARLHWEDKRFGLGVCFRYVGGHVPGGHQGAQKK